MDYEPETLKIMIIAKSFFFLENKLILQIFFC